MLRCGPIDHEQVWDSAALLEEREVADGGPPIGRARRRLAAGLLNDIHGHVDASGRGR